MKEFQGSRTEANLNAAFAGESMARNKYTYYASRAKKDGFEQCGNLFGNSRQRKGTCAELWCANICLAAPFADTVTSLKDAAAGSFSEWTDMYAGLRRLPERKVSTTIAAQFEAVRWSKRSMKPGILKALLCRKRRGRPCVHPGRHAHVAVPQLRPHRHWPVRALRLPGAASIRRRFFQLESLLTSVPDI